MQGTLNWSSAFYPGPARLTPVSVAILQLLCLPLPLIPAKGFSCKSTPKFMTGSHTCHNIHQQGVVINRKVHFFKNRSTFKLCRCYFIVTGAQEEYLIYRLRSQNPHESIDSFRNGTKIMIFQLLSFCRAMTKNGSAAKYQVRPCIEQSFINNKIFLFPTKGWSYMWQHSCQNNYIHLPLRGSKLR